MTVRLAVFSDIHANLPAMEAVAEHIRTRGYDGVYCLGDMGGYAAEPNEVQEAVMNMGCSCIMGNYDDGVGHNRDDCGCHYSKPIDIEMSHISFTWTRAHTTDTNKEWLRALPLTVRDEIEGRRVLFCHGSPRSNTEYLFDTRSDGYYRQYTSGGKWDAQADVILFGHTHVPFHRVVDEVQFVNTGSVGRPKDGDNRAGYTVLTFCENKLRVEQVRVEYDIERACQTLIRAGLPSYFAEYLRRGGFMPKLANEGEAGGEAATKGPHIKAGPNDREYLITTD